MINFILALFFNVSLFAIFKLFDIYKVNTFQAIVTNYVVCIITGLVFIGDLSPFYTISISEPWVKAALVLGILFVSIFYLLALTAQKVSISIATMAAKISLIVPVAVSLWIIPNPNIHFDTINYIGLFLVFLAIPLCSYSPAKKHKGKDSFTGYKALLLIIGVFLGGGMIDTIINWSNGQINLLPNSNALQAIFPIIAFFVAFVIGLVFVLIKRQKYTFKTFIGGGVLGFFNYFSVYFVLKTLSSFNNNAAFVFPNLNMATIIFASLSAVILFKERLHLINWLGLVLSIICIVLISYKELFI